MTYIAPLTHRSEALRYELHKEISFQVIKNNDIELYI